MQEGGGFLARALYTAGKGLQSPRCSVVTKDNETNPGPTQPNRKGCYIPLGDERRGQLRTETSPVEDEYAEGNGRVTAFFRAVLMRMRALSSVPGTFLHPPPPFLTAHPHPQVSCSSGGLKLRIPLRMTLNFNPPASTFSGLKSRGVCSRSWHM